MKRSFRALVLAILVALTFFAGQGSAAAGIAWEREPDRGHPDVEHPVGIALE